MSDNKNEVLSNNMLKLIYSSMQKKIYLPLPIMTDYTYLPMDFTSHYHIHPVYHMVFIFEGQGFLEYTNHSLALKEKDIVLINPMDKHIFTTKDKHLNYFTINFYMFPISTNNDEIDKIIRKYPHNMKDSVLNAETEKLEEIIGIKHKNGFV